MSHERNDTELLDWMIFYSGRVCHSNDGDMCWVMWYSSDEEAGNAGEMETGMFGDARNAIQAAMKAEEMLTHG